jgi:hypothetical protein
VKGGVKKLITIAAAGVVGVVTLALVIKAGIYIAQGRPIAHATGVRLTLLHDTIMLLALLISMGCALGGGS